MICMTSKWRGSPPIVESRRCGGGMFERARSPVGRDVGTVKGLIAPYAADLGMLALLVPGIDARGALEERRAVTLPNTMGAERDLRARVACAESIQSPAVNARANRAFYTGDTRHAIWHSRCYSCRRCCCTVPQA